MITIKTKEMMGSPDIDCYNDIIRPALTRYVVLQTDEAMGCRHLWTESMESEYIELTKFAKYMEECWGEE